MTGHPRSIGQSSSEITEPRIGSRWASSVRTCLARYVGRPFAEKGPFDPDQTWRRSPPPARERSAAAAAQIRREG